MGDKELAPLYTYFEGERGSDTFAADPPVRLDFQRDCTGSKSKLERRPRLTERHKQHMLTLMFNLLTR